MCEKITLCGDNCLACPRYTARTEAELHAAALLWRRAGWRDRVITNEEIRCGGCSSHKQCAYGLVACAKARGVSKCRLCAAFPCEKIHAMLRRMREDRAACKEHCTEAEFAVLSKAFFEKEANLLK